MISCWVQSEQKFAQMHVQNTMTNVICYAQVEEESGYPGVPT
jgi:hypothetical protein